jgi:hypothetical protein
MADDEPHAVVRLLLKRMESHPEEFKRSLNSRWYDIIGEINAWGDEADKAAINAKLRDIRLGEAHEDMMDELLNGPERRRKQEEEQEYERKMVMQSALAQQNAYASQLGRAQSQTIELQGGGGFASIPVGNGGTGASIARYPTSADMKQNGIMNSLRNILK